MRVIMWQKPNSTMFRRFSPYIILLAANVAFSQGAPKLTLDLKEGDKIAGLRTATVTVDSKDLITQVEFYVNGQLRETDDSQPYEFNIDGIVEPEGKLTLRVAAFTNTGKKAEQTINLMIDNGITRGPEFFTKQGEEELRNSKVDESIQSGRLALKAKKDYNPARLLLARANLRKSIFDTAQKFAEDAAEADPKNAAAWDLVSAVHLQRAFNISNRGDRTQILATLKAAFAAAAKARNKVYELRLDAIGAPTTANIFDFADTAIRAGRYSKAIEALTTEVNKDRTNSLLVNRLAYAYMRAGRFEQAGKVLSQPEKRGELDGVGNVLTAILYVRAGQETKSLELERQAILNDGTSMMVRTGQAYLALLRNRTSEFNRLAANLAKEAAENPEVSYYQAMMLDNTKDFEGSRRAFERALLAEPNHYDLLVQRGNQAVAFSFQAGLAPKDAEYQRQTARVYFDGALAVRPESFEALTALAILNVTENKSDDAISYARAATVSCSDFAPAHYTLAMATTLRAKIVSDQQVALKSKANAARSNNLGEEAAKLDEQAKAAGDLAKKLYLEGETAMKKASELDKVNLAGRTIPNALTAWTYLYKYGRAPLLTLVRE